ncbi:hypothetical protein F5Y00DRAFT_256687 [Daldinia vernicosa]|uniref:uncharacterized protein n=1 Tax=Daldinia vernicosa TaxID=114800 RepID=UPI0020078DDE|nr:uncharacterized protein F5Y00DRAFT_256687 [Daldinia vernicosa]KAI0854188.1 hypothetical protein F5Y00DRAFT_256687 [Daldinia vernicosa]
MTGENITDSPPKFTNTFANEQPASPERERTGSRDYSHTDEWDAAKTPPSRFQKRKGSIYATPSSRDGHVDRNREAVEGFHKAHSQRWSISSSGSSRRGSLPGNLPGNMSGNLSGNNNSNDNTTTTTTAASPSEQRRKASQ